MKRAQYAALIVIAVALGTCGVAAAAVPNTFAQQGRLFTGDGVPLEGPSEIEFLFYDAQSGGSVLWNEQLDVEFRNGYFSVILGADTQNPIPQEVVSTVPVFLEIRVGGATALTPRLQVNSVPFALRSAIADRVDGGPVDAAELAVGGTTVVDNEGNWVGPAVHTGEDFALSDQSCQPGDVVTGIDATGALVCDKAALGNQTCEPGSVVAGIDETGALTCLPTELTAAEVVGCDPAQVVARNAEDDGWECVTETDALGDLAAMCMPEQFVRRTLEGDAWECADVTATDTLTALEEAGCDADQLVSRNADDTGWQCVAAPSDTNLLSGGTITGDLVVEGSDSSGPAEPGGALRVASSVTEMTIDGNEIDSSGTLFIQANTDNPVHIGGAIEFSGNGGLITGDPMIDGTLAVTGGIGASTATLDDGTAQMTMSGSGLDSDAPLSLQKTSMNPVELYGSLLVADSTGAIAAGLKHEGTDLVVFEPDADDREVARFVDNGTGGALVVQGPARWRCPPTMTRVGTWCIDNARTPGVVGMGPTMAACHDAGKQLCPLEALVLCDQIEPVGADCSQATDDGPSLRTATLAGATSGTSVFENYLVYDGMTNAADPGASATAVDFYCCTPLNPAMP